MPRTRRCVIDSSIPAISIVPPTRNAPSIGVTASRASVQMLHSSGSCFGFASVRL
jgi:hypothetical protein